MTPAISRGEIFGQLIETVTNLWTLGDLFYQDITQKAPWKLLVEIQALILSQVSNYFSKRDYQSLLSPLFVGGG